MPPPLDPVGIRRWSSHTPMVPMGGSRGRREDLLPGPLGAEDTGRIQRTEAGLPFQGYVRLKPLILKAVASFWDYETLELGELFNYRPFSEYRASEQVAKAYKAMLHMPALWSDLALQLEQLQPPSVRNMIYKRLGSADQRERSWFTAKRSGGIMGFIIPTLYERCDNKYPRVKPVGSSTSKLGPLGVHKAFRKAVLGDLNERISPLEWCLVEVDIVSCHLRILAGLNLQTPLLIQTLGERKNIWKNMISNLSETIRFEFPFPFLKACVKKLAYKCLQGGRIDSPEAIYKTLTADQKLIGKDLKDLSTELCKNQLLQEFDCLNREVVERFDRLGRVEVFTPIDVGGFVLEPTGLPSGEGRTSNACRIASQVVTGVEVLEILILLEGIRKLQLPWVPLSLHHDGFAILARKKDLEPAKELLQSYANNRVTPVGIQSMELEFTPYDKPILTLSEILEAEQIFLTGENLL